MQWAGRKGLHIVFDEVYAGSVHDLETKFCLVGEALGGKLGEDVPVSWSFSKHYCLTCETVETVKGMIY